MRQPCCHRTGAAKARHRRASHDKIKVHPKRQPVEAAAKSKSWRNAMLIHPAARAFPLMSADELKALGEDLRERGCDTVVIDEATLSLLRTAATGSMRLSGPVSKSFTPNSDICCPSSSSGTGNVRLSKREQIADPYGYVVSANIHRRHLSTAQRVELIEKVMKANPSISSRRAAKLAGVSPTTAVKTRDKLEKTGDVSTVHTSIDTKGRKQPTRKPKRTGAPVDLPVKDQINAFHRELSAFVTSFSDRFRAWLETKPKLDDDAHGAMLSGQFVFTESFQALLQEFDGDR